MLFFVGNIFVTDGITDFYAEKSILPEIDLEIPEFLNG